jgi:hypothetical protein
MKKKIEKIAKLLTFDGDVAVDTTRHKIKSEYGKRNPQYKSEIFKETQ